jgi:RNA polymerase sigma-70 factor (ECF subfamily)
LSSTATKYDEATLVQLLKQKDRQVFSYLYDNYSGVLYGIILKIVVKPEEANDLLQDVYLKIWRNIESYDADKSRLYTWMLNIARNTAIDFLRSKQFQNSAKNQNIEDSVNTINQQEKSEQKTDSIGLKQMVEKLPNDQQKVIELVYLNGYTQQETSEELNIPLGTVKTRVRMAINTLKSIFKE